jgi:hypothetical protein
VERETRPAGRAPGVWEPARRTLTFHLRPVPPFACDAATVNGLPDRLGGIEPGMEFPLLLIVIGIILALLVNYAVGLVCILIGLVLLIWPRLRTGL